MEVRIFPDSILRKKAVPIQHIGEEERRLFEQMAKTMYEKKGIGLAANQVGVDKQLLVVDVGEGLIMLANPKVLRRQGKDILEEGCLSIPEITVKVRRAKEISIEALDENGNKIKIDADGLFAKALQHEIDHLCGVLIIDYLSWFKKICLKQNFRIKGV